MKVRNPRKSSARLTALVCLACTAGLLWPVHVATAAQRAFLVMLANSPKQFPDSDGLPPGGLPSHEAIENRYFVGDDSFAAYWEEISYGDVTVSGQATDWINLPWAIQPPAQRASGDDRAITLPFFDSNADQRYEYGQGEEVRAVAAVIIDLDGDPDGDDNGPFTPGRSSGHLTPQQRSVWKPGERFIDMDDDGRWDGLDEANNQMDWDGDGQPDLSAPWVDLDNDGEANNASGCRVLRDSDNDGNLDCCPDGPGAVGCAPYPADGACPATRGTLPGGGEFIDCNGNLIPDVCDVGCENFTTDGLSCNAFPSCGESLDTLPRNTDDPSVPQPDGIPDECQFLDPTEECSVCLPAEEDRTAIARCEFDDSNGDTDLDVVEPFENFLRRWDPCILDPDASPLNQDAADRQSHWIKVYDPTSEATATCDDPPYTVTYNDDSYIRNNYPARHGISCKLSGLTCETTADCCPPGNQRPECGGVESVDDICLTGVDMLIAEAGKRVLLGSHDPLTRLEDCLCPTSLNPNHVDPSERCGCANFDEADPEDYLLQLKCLLGLKIRDELPPGYIEKLKAIPNACIAGWHVEYNPPDDWVNVIADNGPDGDVYSTKMQAQPGLAPRQQLYRPGVRTREPTWYKQAYQDRYPPDPNATATCDPTAVPSATNPCPPDWPGTRKCARTGAFCETNADCGGGELCELGRVGGDNIVDILPFVDADDNTFATGVNRRFFGANAGGTRAYPTGTCSSDGTTSDDGLRCVVGDPLSPCPGGTICVENDSPNAPVVRLGRGVGWIGCDQNLDQDIAFETGDANPSFVGSCDAPILPEESDRGGAGGLNNAGIFYDGWVEHDDLPSSKYHRAGDQRLGEVTSPFDDSIWGDDRGPGTPEGLPFGDGRIAAAGPYATNIHANGGLDGGNLLTMELLTWRNRPPFNNGLAWEYDLRIGPSGEGERRAYHPYAGPSGADMGFRDYNLDGLVDLGETRYPGSENYIAEMFTSTRDNGTNSHYPFNRRRLLEDCVEAVDGVLDFDDFIDQASLAAVECVMGRALRARVPRQFASSDSERFRPRGVGSGIVFLPQESHATGQFPIAPSFYPIHNEDGYALDNGNPPDSSFPGDPLVCSATGVPCDSDDDCWATCRGSGSPCAIDENCDPGDLCEPGTCGERINMDIFFHDLVIALDTPSSSETIPTSGFQIVYTAHEYLHVWEGFPDLYDLDIWSTEPGILINAPVGRWDIMASGDLVHPAPVLKESRCTEWIEPIDLRTVVTPGVNTTITIPPYEQVRDKAAYFLENESRPGERYYFWSVGNSFDERMPGSGMLIMHTDADESNPEGLPNGQSNGTRFFYLIVQADGLGQLDDGVFTQCVISRGPCTTDFDCPAGDVCGWGDASDAWPGPEDVKRFNFDSDPAATWYTQDRWTGIDILNVVEDGAGSVQLTLNWQPTNIPSLDFVDPPGGSTVNQVYKVVFNTTDVFGGTTIELYAARLPDDGGNPDDLANPATAIPVDSRKKTTPGTGRFSMDWRVSDVADGRYIFFAKLIPGEGADGFERTNSDPQANRNNAGNGTLTVDTVNGNKARLEVWTLKLVDVLPDGKQDWVVFSTLSQPEPDEGASVPLGYHYFVDPNPSAVEPYPSVGGEVSLTLRNGPIPFNLGDTWSFTTTGITAVSRSIAILDGQVDEDPHAAVTASPLSGLPPLAVTFDAGDSKEPNGEGLVFSWDFGDGQTATGERVTNTYLTPGTFTARLTATNPGNGRFGQAFVDIEVTNNSPSARIVSDPSSGSPPVRISFDGSLSSDTETVSENLVYQWDFGDGTSANDAAQPGILIETDHLYDRGPNGEACTAQNLCTFTATLTITDEGNKQDTANVEVRIGNTDPVAIIVHTPLRGDDPHEVLFNAIDSVDADAGDRLLVTWDWGDGSDVEGPYPVTGPAGNGNVPHIFKRRDGESRSEFQVSAKVTDQHITIEWTETVVVSDRDIGPSDPTAAFTVDPDPPVAGKSFAVDGRLSFDRPTGERPARFVWNWGDGSPVDTGVEAKHTYVEGGQYTIVLTVSDGETPPNTGMRSKTVLVGEEEGPQDLINHPPTAKMAVSPPSGQGIAGQTAFTFSAEASTDPDVGDTSQLKFTWNFGDGSPRDARAVAEHTYTAPGVYTVTLTATDPFNVSDDATTRIIVTSADGNLPPIAFIGTGPRTGSAPLTLTFNGQNSFDPDDDPLNFRWVFTPALGDAIVQTGAIVTQVFNEGDYDVRLEVCDGPFVLAVNDDGDQETVCRGLGGDGRGGFAPTEIVRVTARVQGEEPEAPSVRDENGEVQDSALARPSALCGTGMIMGLIGSLMGLSVMMVSRRRWLHLRRSAG